MNFLNLAQIATRRKPLSHSSPSKERTKNSSTIKESNFFSSFQEENQKQHYYQDIDECLEFLDEIREDFLKTPSVQNIERYRKVIGNLLEKLAKNYSSQSFYVGIRKRIEMKTWHTADLELKKIGDQFISGEVSILQILDQMKMIKGLVIDLKSF